MSNLRKRKKKNVRYYSLSEIKEKIKNNPLNLEQKWKLSKLYSDNDLFTEGQRGVKIYCKKHKSEQGVSAKYILNNDYLCKSCRRAKDLLTINQLKDKFKEKGYTLITEDFIYATDYLYYICNKHPDIIQKISYDSFIHGHGCKFCGKEKAVGKIKLSLEEITKRFEKRNYEVIEVFRKDGKTFIKYKCKKHYNKIQIIQLSNFINGCGCAYCRSSKGEEKIRSFLENNNIDYISQKTFHGCKDKSLLRFDFYLPKYNLCIEYQGKQHRKPVNLFGKIPDIKKQLFNFGQQLKRDRIKKEFCDDNNIKLLYIFDLEFDKIEEILKKELNL